MSYAKLLGGWGEEFRNIVRVSVRRLFFGIRTLSLVYFHFDAVRASCSFSFNKILFISI
jgi:hypothetical protein